MSADVLDDLARARAEFSRWRASGSGRGRIPSRLWSLAISLVPSHGIAAVARELSINQGRLRTHLRQATAAAPTSSSPAPTFVEVRPAGTVVPTPPVAVPAAAVASSAARLRLRRPDGCTLYIDIAADRFDLLERVLATFLAPAL